MKEKEEVPISTKLLQVVQVLGKSHVMVIEKVKYCFFSLVESQDKLQIFMHLPY